MIELADIRDLAGCRSVVSLQQVVWGADGETVPASVLLVSARRGGILIGAYEDDDLIGFVWSMPGWREGAATQWSHMLAVLPKFRHRGVGARLKIAQRDRALATPANLIEWTFDPLQVGNAHLNFSVLGCTATEYRADAYGALAGPLHRGTPTDRLIAEWAIREPQVERRLAARSSMAIVARDHSLARVPLTIDVRRSDDWLLCGAVTLHDAPRVLVPIPPRFTEMQQEAPPAALAWRMATRKVFLWYFSRGYRAVEFLLDRELGGGRYLLAPPSAGS